MRSPKLSVLFSLCVVFLSSCSQSTSSKALFAIKRNNTLLMFADALVKQLYQDKHIQLYLQDECDEDDAYEMPLRKITIESESINNNSLIAEFSFADNCCSNFYGNYDIIGQSLHFYIKSNNTDYCDCLCIFKYHLQIEATPEQLNHFTIEFK